MKNYLIITSMKFTRSGKYMYKPCPQGQILNAEINAQCHKVSHRVTVTSSDLPLGSSCQRCLTMFSPSIFKDRLSWANLALVEV